MRKLALLAGAASLLAQPVPALANAGSMPAAETWGGIGFGDVIRDLAKKGLISLAVTFTNAGAAIMTNRITQAGTAAKFLGWGTGATAAAVTQTALVTETTFTTTQTNAGGGGANTRTTGTESRTTTSVTNDTYTVTGTMTSTATQTITEVGAFDQAATGGNMNIRSNFTGIGVNNNDSIAFTVNLQLVPSVV